MGAERIAAAFARASGEGRAALMPYMMGGFPDPETAAGVADAYVDAGADLIELGVPFSDPLADGPVIHAAATRAIGAGATLESVLALCERIADRVPVVPMCYANMALAHGKGFAAMLADAGAAGVIVPDLPLEEAGSLGDALAAAEIALVPLVAPTTPEERRERICEAAHGFVYVVSDTRVTGERDQLPPELADLVGLVKAAADVPVAVGFGIGTSEQAATVGRIADGVIIGSRLVRAVAEAESADRAASGAREFLRACREAMSSPRGVG
jgi:tryptophan synthase alpha chain